MKDILKKTVTYFAKILFVVLFGPIILVKVMIDTVLQMMIALIYALLGDNKASDNAIKQVLDKID